jgi:hypothetical protein
VADQLQVAGIRQLDDMVRPFEHGEKGRRLIEQLHEALALLRELARGQHVFGRFGADDEDASHAVRRVWFIDRAVAVRPVHVLHRAMAQDGQQLIRCHVAPLPSMT